MEISSVLTVAFLAVAWIAEAICLKNVRRRIPILTLTSCGILLGCLVAQLFSPALLILFQRNTARVFAGEWWRIVSALFFQDGWLVGGLTNIIALFWIGSIAEQVRSRWYWLAVSTAGALVAECFALWWQPVGAGNSVATCSLAGSLILSRRFSDIPTVSKVLRVVAIAVACSLVAAHNLHGVAGMTGILLGVFAASRNEVET